jgi:hypothetical protein
MLNPNSMAKMYDTIAGDIQKLSSDLNAYLEIPILGTPEAYRFHYANRRGLKQLQ